MQPEIAGNNLQPISRSGNSDFLDSILKDAQEDWMEKEVKNPDTGNMVKVKSLPPKLREKYRPKKEQGPEQKESPEKAKVQQQLSQKKVELHSENLFNGLADGGSPALWKPKDRDLSKDEAVQVVKDTLHDLKLEWKDKPDKVQNAEKYLNLAIQKAYG